MALPTASGTRGLSHVSHDGLLLFPKGQFECYSGSDGGPQRNIHVLMPPDHDLL